MRQMSDEIAATNARLLATVERLKTTQAQLLQAEKLSAIGQLVAGVAHELNNPLTSVIGYAQLVEEELRTDPGSRPPAEVAHDLRRIAEESERAARIVRNLLAFARRQVAARAPQDPAEICTRVLSLREYSFRLTGITLETVFEPGLPKVQADSSQLQQVLLNLVLNAEQAMRGRPQRRLVIGLRHDREAHAVELSVSDSGHGIDAANLSRIFDPFFTTRDVGEGTGLGLSICYGIVRDHGGQIAVESRPQEGTTFRVKLPASLDDPAVRGAEVVVAHAEQTQREFVTAALQGWGYRVVSAATLQEALEAAARPALHLAIVDRGLLAADPDAWKARRAAQRELPMILTAMTPDDAVIEEFGRDGAAVLTAPVTLASLNAAMQTVVKEYV
jgi:two-component system NtrC family sensor kinase